MAISMKHLVFVLALALAGALQAAPAAKPADDAALMESLRRDLAIGKRALIEKHLRLTPTEASKFWPLYDKYERDVQVLVSRQNRSVLDFVQAETYLTDLNAKRIGSDMVKVDTEELRLRDKVFKKVLSILPGKKAVRYIQLEMRINTLTRYDLAQRLPLAQ